MNEEYPRLEKTFGNVDFYHASPNSQYQYLYCYHCVLCGAHTWYPETHSIIDAIKNPMKCHVCGDMRFVDYKKVSDQMELFPEHFAQKGVV